MSEEDFNKKDNLSDSDKDFGLPKIVIKPIQDADTKPAPLHAAPLPVEEKPGQSPDPVKPVVAGPIVPESKDLPVDERKKNNSLIWIILVLILIGMGLGGWFYYNSNQAPEVIEEPLVNEVPEKPLPVEPEPVPEEVPAAAVEENVLTEISSRAESPRYFIVVASFIDEDLARDYSNALNAQGMSTFLVHPYGDIAYHRLAIGQFENFALASQEISRIKDSFEENLWVLKY